MICCTGCEEFESKGFWDKCNIAQIYQRLEHLRLGNFITVRKTVPNISRFPLVTTDHFERRGQWIRRIYMIQLWLRKCGNRILSGSCIFYLGEKSNSIRGIIECISEWEGKNYNNVPCTGRLLNLQPSPTALWDKKEVLRKGNIKLYI